MLIAILMVCFISLVFSGCNDDIKPQDTGKKFDVSQLIYKTRELHYIEEGCDTSETSCVQYKVSYPEFYFHESGYNGEPSNPLNANGNVAVKINRDIMRAISGVEDSLSHTLPSPSSRFDSLLTKFRRDTALAGRKLPAYSEQITIIPLTNKYGILCLEELHRWYKGEDHAMYKYNYLNYDLSGNSKLEFEDVFGSSNTSMIKLKEELASIGLSMLADTARQKLGRNLALEETEILKMSDLQVLNKAGYFSMEEFEISTNFAILSKGIRFIYNTHHLPGFENTDITIFMPYESIKTYLRTDSPVRRMFVDELTQ